MKTMAVAESSKSQCLGKILLAEDDREMRHMLSQTLIQDGYFVHACRDGAQLIDHLSTLILEETTKEHYDLIISDIRMPGVSGMSVLRGINELKGFPPVIIITAFGDERIHTEARSLGAAVVLDKPFPLNEFLRCVQDILTDKTKAFNSTERQEAQA